MRFQKSSRFVILSLLLISLTQPSCSGPAKNANDFVNCQHQVSPTLIKPDFKFPGDLLFMKRDTSEIVAFNGETHEMISIYKPPIDAFVSPLSQDGNTLLVSYSKPSDKENLVIETLSNLRVVETKSIPFPVWTKNEEKPNSWLSVDWANKEYLLGVLYDEQHNGDRIWETWLLNPYQSKWKSLSSLDNTLDPAEQSGFSISPDLTKVLYVSQKFQLVLYDINQNKILWEYGDYDGINPVLNSPSLADATWSKDGSMLAMPISNHANQDQPGTLILDQSGKILHVVDFGNREYGLSWSNDDKFLAFWGNQITELTTSTSDWRSIIRVMEISTRLVRDLCILNENFHPWGHIFWSPDQEFLAYTVQDYNTKRDELLIQKLIDPQLRVIHLYDETQNFDFLGWSQEHWNKARQ